MKIGSVKLRRLDGVFRFDIIHVNNILVSGRPRTHSSAPEPLERCTALLPKYSRISILVLRDENWGY